jgi:homoaconitase/3-isopropylmalate dehydratase large subunit
MTVKLGAKPRRTAGVCFDCLRKEMSTLYKVEKAWVCGSCAETRLEQLSLEIMEKQAKAEELRSSLDRPGAQDILLDVEV